MYIILYGNLSEGFKAVGPFADFDEAADACDTVEATLGWSQTWVMEVDTLVEYKKGMGE